MDEIPSPPSGFFLNVPVGKKPTNVKSKTLNNIKLKKVEEKDMHYVSVSEFMNKMENLSLRMESKRRIGNKLPKKENWMVWHGKFGKKEWKIPTCVAKTEKVNRIDQGNITNASEFCDDPKVLDEKMKIVADLIKRSKFCIAYTGAGISRDAGIPDYGSTAEDSVTNKVKELKNVTYALPTYSHHVLANLEKLNLVKYYVQQNHDGLPQKAGFPQEKMNEIHGAWFDPSNPVVQFSGNLRNDLFMEMLEIEQKADLCLCLGTSLSGMNSDRCVTTPCEKFAGGVSACFGSVIINLQFTPIDIEGYLPIRVWAKIDDAMKLLVKHLNIKIQKREIPIEQDIIVCPYNKKGKFDDSKKMILNLKKGERVRICHPKAENKGKIGVVSGKDNEGNYFITFDYGMTMRLGKWWMNTIKRGKIKQAPIVNINPKFEEKL